jgi:hypothetical protein
MKNVLVVDETEMPLSDPVSWKGRHKADDDRLRQWHEDEGSQHGEYDNPPHP